MRLHTELPAKQPAAQDRESAERSVLTAHRQAAGEAHVAEQQVVDVALVRGHVDQRVRPRQAPQPGQAGLVHKHVRAEQQPGP